MYISNFTLIYYQNTEQIGDSPQVDVTALVKLWPYDLELIFKAVVDTALFLISFIVQQKFVFAQR